MAKSGFCFFSGLKKQLKNKLALKYFFQKQDIISIQSVSKISDFYMEAQPPSIPTGFQRTLSYLRYVRSAF